MRQMYHVFLAVLLLLLGGCDRGREISPDEALRRAAEQGSTARVQRALARGADVNARNRWGGTPLHVAASRGHVAVAELLIARGADVNALDRDNETPLHGAVRNGHPAMTRLLLEQGAGDMGAPGGLEATLTPLLFGSPRADIMELLIARGANPRAKGHEGNTPLHDAASRGSKDGVQLLLRHGVDPNATNDLGQTPAMLALDADGMIDGGFMEQGKRESVKLLIEAGAKIASIHLAVFMGDRAKVEAFLQQGADPNEPLLDRRTPLHVAAREGHAEVIEALVAHHASVQARDVAECTPLFTAVRWGRLDVVSALVSAGADVNGLESAGVTVLHVAASHGHREVAELLLTKGATVHARDANRCTPLHYAAEGLQAELVDVLITHGADVSARSVWGQTPLHDCLEAGLPSRYRCWDYASGMEWDPDRNVERLSETQIEELARRLRVATVECLVKHGADVNAMEGSDGTPLHMAAARGLAEVVELLLTNGAHIDTLGRQGRTPLHDAAAESGDRKTIELLFRWGADVRAMDDDAHTPLDLVRRRWKNPELERLLTPSDSTPDRLP